MKRVKQIIAGVLSGTMLLGCGWMAGIGSARAAEDGAVSGTVYSIYKAFTEDGRDTDPEFGTRSGSLNSSLSPRVIELQYQEDPEDNGKMYATFECNRLPKTDAELVSERQGNGDNISDSLSGFPIYESLDGGATWGGGYADTSARGNNYVPVGYVQNQGAENGVTGMRNCPQLYEMPETVGDLEKGTILCAGNSIEAGENGNAADVTQSGITYLDLCISDDLGRTWEHHSSIVGPIEGVCGLLDNTVWEPFFLTFEGRLYCFYSDESIDDTTDQDISYVYYDGEKWSEKQQLIYTRGARPGMPIVSQLEDGRFMLTFELNGGGQSGYILSTPNDPTQWYAADGSLQKTVSQADAIVINGSGAPYNITTESGAILYDNTSLSQIWRNTSEAPDEAGAYWIYYYTGLGSAYNRQIMERSDGRIFVVGGWNGSGISCVTLDYEMNLEKTGSLESKVDYNGASTYLAYNGTPMFTWTGTGGHAEPNQFYEFREADDGSYVLVSTNNGKAMQVQTEDLGSQVDTVAIDMEDPGQRWIFEEAEDGWYYVKNAESGLYLTTPRTDEADTMDNRYLTMEEKRKNDDSQLWKPDFVADETVPEPTETAAGWLSSGAASNMYLAVDGGTAEEGKGIILWTGPETNQEWQFQPTDSGTEYYIVNITTNKALSSPGTDENQQLVQYTKNEDDASQLWIFEKTGTDGAYYIRNKATGLYVTANGTGGLAAIVQRTGTGTAMQIWNTDAEVNAVPSEMEDFDGLESGLASASNTGDESTDQYLAVNGGSTADGAELSTWTGLNGGPEPNQVWAFRETDEEGVYRIVNTNSGRAIAAQNRVEGQRLVQKTIDENDETQLWSFVATEKENTYRIWNNSTRFYLTADVPASGSRVLQKNYEDSDLQLWVTDAEVVTKDITYDYSISIVRKDGVSVTYTVDDATGAITFLASPREYYEVSGIDLEINGTALGNGTENSDGSVEFVYTPDTADADLTVHATADVKTTDYYIINPEDNYSGRNQCLSPRVVEGLNGELYATFENGTPSEIQPDEYSFPIYRSDDKGETWTRVGEILNDDTVHPDSYYRITSYTDTGAPSTAVEVEEGDEGAVRHPWSMQNCPQLFVLPEDAGGLEAGTLICAGVAVPVEAGAEEVSDAGYGGLWDSSLDLYYSTDGGATWTYRSTIATGGENGRNIMGYDPIWEPFFVYYEDTLICYYSDETVPGDNGGQILVYKTSTDGGATWSGTTTIVDTHARPGMPVVSQMANGKWILTYETVGLNPIKAGYKIADNPFDWENVSDWGDTLPGINGTYGGSPYVYTLADGRIVAGTGSLSEVFVNTREDATGDWIACETGAPAGYNRCYLQLSTGEFVIAGTEGSGFAGQGNKIFVKVMDPDEVFSAVPTFDSISVTGPDTTEYDLGDDLDLTGLVVTANYSDGSSREISSDAYTVSGYDADTAGKQEITVAYAGKTDTFTVTVKEESGTDPQEPVLERIEVTTLPDKTEYKVGEELDLTGMVVTAYYSNHESEAVTDYTVEGFDSSAAGGVELTVRYGDKTTVFTVNVTEESTEPGGEDPSQPGGENPSQPGGEDPSDPGQTGGEDPEQPGGEDPSQPGGENPGQPGGENPADPGQPDGNDQNTGGDGQSTDGNVQNSGSGSNDGAGSNSPKTGDSTNLLLWACAAAAALAAAGYTVVKRKKVR